MMNRVKTAGMLAACACFIGALGAAPATNTNHMIFTSFSAVGDANPDVDGLCKLTWRNTTDGTVPITSAQLTISNLAPDTTYGVSINGDGGGAAQNAAFTTNHGGHGSWDIIFPFPPAPGTTVTIFVNTQDDAFSPNPADIRAVATAN
jgi:hypothetical protein